MNKQGTSVNSVAAQPLAAKRRFGTRQITIVGMLGAVSVVLGLTGIGSIQILPSARITIMHIPIVLGAILEGPIVGALIGLIFGVFSLIQNITSPTSILSPALMDPLVSVFPRILIGITTFVTYRYILGKLHNLKTNKFNTSFLESFRVGFAAAIGSLTNTIGVLGLAYILHAADLIEKLGGSGSKASVLTFLAGIVTTNGILEVAGSVIVTIPVVYAVRKIRK